VAAPNDSNLGVSTSHRLPPVARACNLRTLGAGKAATAATRIVFVLISRVPL
jgi:hypothetical protein